MQSQKYATIKNLLTSHEKVCVDKIKERIDIGTQKSLPTALLDLITDYIYTAEEIPGDISQMMQAHLQNFGSQRGNASIVIR